MNNDFEKIGTLTRTDKVQHGYQRFYPREVEDFRYFNFTLVEIGFGLGSSLELWKRYFPHANIFILDKDRGFEYSNERSMIVKGDQGNIDDLNNFASIVEKNSGNKPVCFINDDGSHIPSHQLQTFDIFFSRLLIPGGVYIIEDVETSYWKEKFTISDEEESIVDKFKLLVDYTNKAYVRPEDIELLEEKTNFVSDETKRNILSISFQQNCIIIRKKDPYRDYAFDERYYIKNGAPQRWAF